MVLGVSVVGVIALGLVGGAFSFVNRPAGPAQPTVPVAASPTPSILRTTPSSAPASTDPVTGAGVGQQVPFASGTSAGTLRVTKATWTNQGSIQPPDGEAYLIVELTLTVTKGQLTTGLIWARVLDESGEPHIFAIGPKLDTPLPTGTVQAGRQVSGQLGYSLPRGPATFQLLDERLAPMVSVEIPG